MKFKKGDLVWSQIYLTICICEITRRDAHTYDIENGTTKRIRVLDSELFDNKQQAIDYFGGQNEN